MYSKVLSRAQTFWRSVPDVPADASIVDEIRLLIRHKTMAVPDDAKRRSNGTWTKATRTKNRGHLWRFARYAMLDRGRGGLGLPAKEIFLALFLNWRILAAYMEFIARVFEDVEHDGERRGPLLTVYDLMILQLAASLLTADYGWLRQRVDLFKDRLKVIGGSLGPFPGLEELRIRHAGDGPDGVDAEEIEHLVSASNRLFRQTMPAEIVDAANTNWFEAFIDARDKINNLRTYLLTVVDTSRSPFELIQNIIDSDKPLNFLRDIAQAA